ncbi:cyclic-phosphate processing receiver domain-containing protein [Albidovulum aquaemixtae]|uniref:cyclic-phosphate processing receiver domain-containing protein n=1 Tax=Albidovulum aquaemixtae TaxID=1542388 RepID=UPI000D55E3E6|nr:cyclic-phosphate processing receiver domain-containing protein [Defluviimonas aquaemixtae]
MRVFLDDIRMTPEGWVRVYWPEQAIALLETGDVELISLDYDLGDAERGTGIDVLVWLEDAVRERGFHPPEIRVHSDDRLARIKMQMMADSIMSEGSERQDKP